MKRFNDLGKSLLRRLKGWRELRALGTSELMVMRRVSEGGLIRRRKMRGEKEVTVYRRPF